MSWVTSFSSFPSSFPTSFSFLFDVFMIPFCLGAGLSLAEDCLKAPPVLPEHPHDLWLTAAFPVGSLQATLSCRERLQFLHPQVILFDFQFSVLSRLGPRSPDAALQGGLLEVSGGSNAQPPQTLRGGIYVRSDQERALGADLPAVRTVLRFILRSCPGALGLNFFGMTLGEKMCSSPRGH